MKKQRKHYTPEEKVAILRRHLKTEIGAGRFIQWLDITASKFYG